MNSKLRERVLQLEHILLGNQDDQNPLSNNRLDVVIKFMSSMASEMSKTQSFLENLLQELQNKDILSEVQIEHLKIVSDLNTDLGYLKERLADLTLRENELNEYHNIPEELKKDTKKAKISLVDRIEEIEAELEKLKKHEYALG